MFMITERYSDRNDIIQQDEVDNAEQHENSTAIEDTAFEEETETWNFDNNAASQNAGNFDGEWEDEVPEYDIFEDNDPNSSDMQEPNGSTV